MTELRIAYPLSALPDDKLAAMFAAVSQWFPHAKALATDTCKAFQLEAFRRDGNRRQLHAEPASEGFAFDAEWWSDRDVADGLLLVQSVSLGATDPMLTEFANEMARSITNLAVYRLSNSTDPRNAIDFDIRFGALKDDPETDE